MRPHEARQRSLHCSQTGAPQAGLTKGQMAITNKDGQSRNCTKNDKARRGPLNNSQIETPSQRGTISFHTAFKMCRSSTGSLTTGASTNVGRCLELRTPIDKDAVTTRKQLASIPRLKCADRVPAR
ncbi:hypothetical protein NDU88_004427 [Pleurodeles waltl]|uniref:Uncharacterized protein n=1 Tax=Pleurodeles waltl TaxID=8319 RepID=A0AAV7V3F7_PLEWA|nr:hypothetical protein NDU88_004427 [Pleurodeles waltl]